MSTHAWQQNEIEHGRRIASHAEQIWGWASPAGRRRADRRASLLIDWGRICEGSRVLELGCGTGTFTQRIASTGAEITAIDLSPDLIAMARKEVQLHISLVLVNVEKLSFPDETFEVVCGSSVLHHLNVGNALNEIHRVLRPGGRLALAEPNMINPQIAIQKNIKWIKRRMGDLPHETAFFSWRLGATLQRIGFNEVSIYPFDFLHPLTPPLMIDTVDKLGRYLEKVPIVREIAGSLLISAEKPE
jgi:2-polyprenyl-3-methyl-5-hydroxy-6-metoxy-1,4-benzoquinol methylase